MTFLLGCIADDFTGATDLAGMLVNAGMRTVQVIGIPDEATPGIDADAVVIALKSRTIPAQEAVAQTLAAQCWLAAQGCQQFFFKYCSTFDSTDEGNIGPVTDALLYALNSDFTIACPAFPQNHRTVYKGHLFVGDTLLSESSMRHHPLTPMQDSNLVRVLARQTRRPVGLVPFETVRGGPERIKTAFEALRKQGVAVGIVDALDDADLHAIGAAAADLSLITGGSGIAMGLPENFRRQRLLSVDGHAADLPAIKGHSAVIAGSCSAATREQVAVMQAQHPSFQIDPLAIDQGRDLVAEALAWARPKLATGPVLIYATATPDQVRSIQEQLGVQQAGDLVEETLSRIAQGLVTAGVRKLVVAGGETSGAVVKALEVRALRIGPQIDPGVPWTTTLEEPRIALALKSGNFGAPDFFLKALRMLP